MVVSMFLSGNTKFFVIEILPEHLMTCDTVLLMEVACDEPKKPLKISLPNAGKYHTQHGKTRTKNCNQQKLNQKQKIKVT